MRAISSNTRTLIEQLGEPIGWWKKLTGSRTDADTLSRIGNAGEPAAIIDILPFVLADRTDIAQAAATAIHKLLVAAPSTDLAWLDITCRERSLDAGRYRLAWDGLLPTGFHHLEGFGDASVSLLGMASFHKSGYVREEATKRLASVTSGFELPFLLIRLNDWVPAIREAASKAITSRLNADHCRGFVANLALISRLEGTARASDQPLLTAIYELLRSASCQSLILEAINSHDRYIRRASFRLTIDSTEFDLSDVLKRALTDNDTVIRLWAARRVSSALEGGALDHALAEMRNDRFMPVRREALRISVTRRPEHACAELRSALLDTNPSIRREARYQLQRLDPIDVASFYRNILSGGEQHILYSAISGLGEVGSAADADLLVPHASHRAPRIRSAVIRALRRLRVKDHVVVLVNALTDENSNVSREALRALADKSFLVGNDRLWEIFCSTSHLHVKGNALRLLERLGKWDSIYYMVKAISDSDKDIADLGRIGIRAWLSQFNRRFSPPTPEQMGKLRQILEESDNLLDEITKKDLWFSLKGFE